MVEFYHNGRTMITFLVSGASRRIGLPRPPPGYLYRTTLVQAAPGKLLEVVDLYKAGWPGTKDSGDEPPIAMRHSQGDRWDLLLLFPMGSWGDYYAADRIARRQKARDAAKADLSRLSDDVAWTEDVFVYGPPLEETRGARRRPATSTSRCSRRCPGWSAASTASARWRTPTSSG